ncbi:type II toxin-antitoxin system HipA family toxin YjjJ [Andreprevotia chitinilytica]|uniref:type II toxin-antitoxin system HipA family toxin YjjJ n=1 Tax=Andreprevotia chitinilytica TaxID=396808 RepID=UPI00055057D9|nr:type II toxin-antitoxin system HipA family toxin YjjJ [Andreprevotia chitinilytica]
MPSNDPLLALLNDGPLPARTLCEQLGISQPTLSRRVAALGDGLLRFGKARQSSYARRRQVAGQFGFTLHRVDANGRLVQWGTLYPVWRDGCVVIEADGNSSHHDGLPWWLQDMRPQGFLGRAFAHSHAAALNLPADLNAWGDSAVLLALAQAGEDSVGNLLLGDTAASRLLARPEPHAIPTDARITTFAELSRLALAGEAVGSSAGGEQPKFTATISTEHGPQAVLVKFSAPDINAASQRWASLLVAEHLALQTLAAADLPASQSELLQSERQTFLQLQRFDRIGLYGRRGVVSLAALDHGFIGRAGDNWPQLTGSLAAQRIITPESDAIAQRLHAFGVLIGNSDMHHGNLSFLHDGNLPLTIAPAYDMLPMHYAPRASGHLPEALPELALATPPNLDVWAEVLPHAQNYWRQVGADTRIDDGFRTIAGQWQARLAQLATRL